VVAIIKKLRAAVKSMTFPAEAGGGAGRLPAVALRSILLIDIGRFTL
jgi:hypothetical protein